LRGKNSSRDQLVIATDNLGEGPQLRWQRLRWQRLRWQGFIFEDVVVQKTPRYCRDQQEADQRLFNASRYS
jgi:hypothetical protein